MKSDEVKKLDEARVRTLFPAEELFLSVNASATIMHGLTHEITRIEKAVLARVKLRKEFRGLLALPGIGDILGLTVMREAGDIRRFPEGRRLLLLLPMCEEHPNLEWKKHRNREQEERQ